MITYAKESYEYLSTNGGLKLFKMNWEEVPEQDYNYELNIDHASFINLDLSKRLCCIGARDSGELVGYIVVIIYVNLHNTQVLSGLVDTIFVRPEYRTTGDNIGKNLVCEAEELLKSEFNVQVLKVCSTVNKDISALPKRLGYEESEVIYTKRLGEA